MNTYDNFQQTLGIIQTTERRMRRAYNKCIDEILLYINENDIKALKGDFSLDNLSDRSIILNKSFSSLNEAICALILQSCEDCYALSVDYYNNIYDLDENEDDDEYLAYLLGNTYRTIQPLVETYVDRFREELDAAIIAAIFAGRPLEDFNDYIRRFMRNTNKVADVFHDGVGLRNSMSALKRVNRTESTRAFWEAEYNLRQSNDDIVGQYIHLAPYHPYTDICDDLEGYYPKEFKFTGWHPNCRCISEPIYAKDNNLNLSADDFIISDTIVEQLPAQYSEWVANNQSRILNSKNLPYFLKDNGQIVNNTYIPNKYK